MSARWAVEGGRLYRPAVSYYQKICKCDRNAVKKWNEMNEKRKAEEYIMELQIGSNGCTEPINVRPVKAGSWNVISTDLTDEEQSHWHDYASLIFFDKRQIWEVYYFHSASGSGWVAQRGGMYLRMTEKDFEKFFGKYKIKGFNA